MFCWRKIQKQQLKKVPFGMTDETTHIPLSLWACTSPIAVELLTFSCIGSQRQWHRYCASFMDVESFLDRLNACPRIRFERQDLTEETPRGEAFWSKTKCEEKKELIMKRGLHRAHYNYENWLAFKKNGSIWQLKSKESMSASQLRELAVHRQNWGNVIWVSDRHRVHLHGHLWYLWRVTLHWDVQLCKVSHIKCILATSSAHVLLYFSPHQMFFFFDRSIL